MARAVVWIDMQDRSSADIPPGFGADWHTCFGRFAPLGHVLRQSFAQQWTRFHALPRGKRYADSEAERRIILERANELAEACFGGAPDVWLAVTHLPEEPAGLSGRLFPSGGSERLDWRDIEGAMESGDEVTVLGGLIRWRRQLLDDLFELIAEDAARAVLYSRKRETVLAPYDGGFDIISLRPGGLAELEERFGDWMSPRADKL